MKSIPLFNDFINIFNENFSKFLTPFNLEPSIMNVGDLFTIKLFESILNHLDYNFKHSNERKLRYYVKQTRKQSLLTSFGYITINYTSYIDKETKKSFVPLRDILYLKPYQRLTNHAEYQLVKYAMDENMSQSAQHALRNTVVSRSTVSKKISRLDGSIQENITRVENQPDVLYIEMDEIHANLQKGGNKICPCAIVHEGYEEDFVKRKKLKNVRYFASAKLSYEELWNVIYDYVDKRYDINKFNTIFISGDGASGIKNYTDCFPEAKFVLDPFHYIRKHLRYIFKNDNNLKDTADDYIRNDLIDDFKTLVNFQIEKYPEQKDYMINHMNTIINNIAKLQSEINNAEIGSSIMIANGTFNISSPILIPKSKNLTIFGESQDVTITSSGNALFMLVNDVDDSSTHNTIIANMTLKSNNQNNSIILIDNDTSINNLNNINITLLKINFEVPTNGNAINLSSKTDGFEQTQLEKVNLTLNQCNIYNNGSSEVNDNNTIIINGINESEINIKDCTLISKCNLINIENGNNITLNIENSFLESNVCSLNFENVLGGEIIVTKQSYIKGFPAINMTNCSDLEVTIENSYLTVYQQSEDLEENKSSVILLTGCQNINISSKDTTLNTLYKNDEDYINAICYIILIQDGTTLSSNNNISLTDCNIITTNEIKFLNLEKEPTSVINQYTTEE